MVKRFSADKPSARQERMASVIHEIISKLILSNEVLNVKPLEMTINAVTVSPDLRQASIYVVPFPKGTGKKARTSEKIMYNIQNARKFIRTKVAQDLTSKMCPELHFFQDVASENTIQFEKLLVNLQQS